MSHICLVATRLHSAGLINNPINYILDILFGNYYVLEKGRVYIFSLSEHLLLLHELIQMLQVSVYYIQIGRVWSLFYYIIILVKLYFQSDETKCENLQV